MFIIDLDYERFQAKKQYFFMKESGFPSRLVALVVVLTSLVLVSFLLFDEVISSFLTRILQNANEHRGLSAVILFAALASDIFLPIPSSIVSTLCGGVLGFWRGFAVSFAAMNTSALVGYLLGRFSSRPIEKMLGERDSRFLSESSERYGCWLLLMLRPVPILAEASVIFAGLGRLPAWRSAWALVAGNAVVSATYAIIGVVFDNESCDGTLWAFGAAMAVSGLFFLAPRMRRNTSVKKS